MLPEKKTSKTPGFFDCKFLIISPPKGGKTSLVAAVPCDILFFAFEHGHDFVDGYISYIETWKEFKAKLVEMKGGDRFRMFCVDTLDAAWICYMKCFLAENKLDYEGDDNAYGRARKIMQRGFRNDMHELQFFGRGYFILAHEFVEESYDEKGNISRRLHRANFPESKNDIIRAGLSQSVDAIWSITKKRRVVEGRPSMMRVLCTNRYNDGIDEYELDSRFPIAPEIDLVEDDPAASMRKIGAAYKAGQVAKDTAAAAAAQAATPPKTADKPADKPPTTGAGAGAAKAPAAATATEQKPNGKEVKA